MRDAVGERSDPGAQAFLSQIETGKRDGTIDTLRRIAAALRVSLDELAG